MIRRPFDTAPVDGRPFIAWRGDRPTTARYSPEVGMFVRADTLGPWPPDSIVGATEWEPIGSLEGD